MNKTITGIHVRTTGLPASPRKIYATAVEDSTESCCKLLNCEVIAIYPVSVCDIKCCAIYDGNHLDNHDVGILSNETPSMYPRIFHRAPTLYGDIFLCGPADADGNLTSLTREQIHTIIKRHVHLPTILAADC